MRATPHTCHIPGNDPDACRACRMHTAQRERDTEPDVVDLMAHGPSRQELDDLFREGE